MGKQIGVRKAVEFDGPENIYGNAAARHVPHSAKYRKRRGSTAILALLAEQTFIACGRYAIESKIELSISPPPATGAKPNAWEH